MPLPRPVQRERRSGLIACGFAIPFEGAVPRQDGVTEENLGSHTDDVNILVSAGMPFTLASIL